MLPPEEPRSPNFTGLSLENLLYAIGDPTRWRALCILAGGEARQVNELAKMLGKTPAVMSKHLAVLRRMHLVVISRGLQQIDPRYRLPDGVRELDLGHCVMRI